MVALVERFPGFAVLAGADPLMLPLLRKGGAGCITATSNLVARDLAFIFRHHADPARAADVDEAQARVVAMRAPGVEIRTDRVDQGADRQPDGTCFVAQAPAAAAAR